MAFPTLYIDTAGNGGAVTNSGSTDASAATVSGANGCSVAGTTVTLTGTPNLSAIPTDGSATIYIADATNANQKIFRITAVDDGLDTVTVDTAPTGSIANSAWAIGGRHLLPSASNLEGALKAGWTVVINNDITTATTLTARSSGNSTDGFITLKGKQASPRPKITGTTGITLTCSTFTNWLVQDLELDNTVASTMTISLSNTWYFVNCKLTKTGGTATSVMQQTSSISHNYFIGCEITGSNATNGYNARSASSWYYCYIHDVTGAGVIATDASPGAGVFIGNVIDTCAAQGVYYSSASIATVAIQTFIGNTIANCGNSGIETADADLAFILLNNIAVNNGDASGEFNIEILSAEPLGVHRKNIIFHTDSAKNYSSGFVPNALDITTDPLLINIVGANFQPGAGSPALLAALAPPTLANYLDIGAIQRSVTGGSGAQIISG